MVYLTQGELARQRFDEVLETREFSDRFSLAEIVDRYGVEGIVFDLTVDYDYSDCSFTLAVIREREENDEEYEARLEKLRKRKLATRKATEARKRKREAELAAEAAAQHEKDRETFEALREKYNW